MFEAFPNNLQQQALLRIGLNGLARRHPEKGGVETIDVADDASEKVNALAGYGSIWMRVSRRAKSVARNFGNTAAALFQQPPKLVSRCCARQSASVAHY